MLRKLKLISLGLLSLLVMVLCLQNLATIQVHVLFTTVELPQAVVLIGTLAVGFVMGILANTLLKLRSWRAKSAAEKAQQAKTSSNNPLTQSKSSIDDSST